ncbi:MAG: creatininase family protein [Candidatus Thorarchaeota archaeon]
MKTILIEDMNWLDIQEAMQEGFDTVIVAIGSMEQHGPHLPIKTDTLIGEALVVNIAKKMGNTLVGPTISMGCSAHHLAFQGTISLQSETLKAIISDYTDSLIKHGFKKIVFIPSHGGNFSTVEEIVEILQAKYSQTKIIGFTDLFKFLEILQTASSKKGISTEEAGAHAGENETSLILALNENLVQKNRIAPGYMGPFGENESVIIFKEGMKKLTENGILGDPSKASLEKGQFYLELLTDDIIKEIKKMD